MKKFLLVISMIFISAFAFCGCNFEKVEDYNLVDETRFVILKSYEKEWIYGSSFIVDVVVDKETKIEYFLIFYTTHGISITPVLDENGNYVYYEGEL